MTDVFISYNRGERAVIEVLAAKLAEQRLSVWFDSELRAGEEHGARINDELRKAKAVLVCWSPAACSSRWVRAEALVGFDEDKLVSVYIAGDTKVMLPAPFNSIHAEDLRSWVAAPGDADFAWRSVLRRISSLCDRPDLAGPARTTGLRWTPKAIRIGLEYGWLKVGAKGPDFTERLARSFWSAAEGLATTEVEHFLAEGWTPLVVRAIGEAKHSKPIMEDDFYHFCIEVSKVPLSYYSLTLGAEAKILSLDVETYRPTDEVLEDFLEVIATKVEFGELKDAADLPKGVIDALNKVCASYFAANKPEWLGATHLLSLTLYSVYEFREIGAKAFAGE